VAADGPAADVCTGVFSGREQYVSAGTIARWNT
jgi:hypothetical protein